MSALNITVQALLAAAGVSALVSNRVWPVEAPQEAAEPNIIVHLIAEPVDPLLCEDAPVSRVQVDCRAETWTAADALGEAVKTALGAVVSQTVASKRATILKEGSDVSAKDDKGEVFIRSIDFNVHWWAS